MSDTVDQALLFSSTMDRLFDHVAERLNNGRRRRLLCERRLPDHRVAKIRMAASLYLAACLDLPGLPSSESELLACLAERKSSLANLTPNGVLMPKREHTVEYNLMHKSVRGALAEFLTDDLVESIQSRIIFRIVEGTANHELDRRAYATSKLHSDVWAGDPLDSITILIPVLGDPQNITVEFKEMPAEVELEYMRPLEDYSIGSGIAPLLEYEDVDFRIGSMVMFDARLLHQTVRKSPGFRISLDFRFRRKAAAADEMWLKNHPDCNSPLNPLIDYTAWKSIGTDSLLVVSESCAEARASYAAGAARRSAGAQIISLADFSSISRS